MTDRDEQIAKAVIEACAKVCADDLTALGVMVRKNEANNGKKTADLLRREIHAIETILRRIRSLPLSDLVAALPKEEPIIWMYRINDEHDCFSPIKPPEDAYDEGTLVPLYAALIAQPDDVIECRWTPDSPDACPYCSGEMCYQCGVWPNNCQHDSLERHTRPATQDKPVAQPDAEEVRECLWPRAGEDDANGGWTISVAFLKAISKAADLISHGEDVSLEQTEAVLLAAQASALLAKLTNRKGEGHE